MELMYSSTRNDKVKLTASQAILKGLADDGGLFVPERIPALDVPMDTLADMSYQETAYEVMSRFFTDFTEDELKDCIKKAYDSKFDTPEIAPLVDADGAYYLELVPKSTSRKTVLLPLPVQIQRVLPGQSIGLRPSLLNQKWVQSTKVKL
jgi:threonine synthase